MPNFGPVSRRELTEALRRSGFSGPYPGGRHEFMSKARIVRQAGISRSEWESL